MFYYLFVFCFFFFFQAEDGIRDLYVTGVQTCALPIFRTSTQPRTGEDLRRRSTRTRVDLRPALAATGLRLYFPHLAVGTDVHVTTPDQTTVAVPPMPLNLHPPTLQVPQAHRETVTILDGWAAPQAPGLPSRTAIRRPLTRYPTSDLTGLGDRRRRCPIPGEGGANGDRSCRTVAAGRSIPSDDARSSHRRGSCLGDDAPGLNACKTIGGHDVR